MANRMVTHHTLQHRRISLAFWPILICYVALVVRLVYLQGVHGPTIRNEAVKMRERKVPLVARRGTIYDRENRPLAVSIYSGILGFDPSVLATGHSPQQAAELEQRLNTSIVQIADLLDVPQEQIRSRIADARVQAQKNPKLRFVVIRKDISLDSATALRNAHPPLLGFGVLDSTSRAYSSGANAAQVVGFLGANDHALAGIERACQGWLVGKTGSAVGEVDAKKRLMPDTLRSLQPSRDGYDVHTTLDPNAQHFAMQEAQRIYDQYHPKGVSIVIVDPNNGDILSLVSVPTLDPNPEERKHLKLEAQNDPRLAERCAATLYEPGSTLKALTVAAALDDGTITTHSTFHCTGALVIGKKAIHCPVYGPWDRYGHGWVNAREILRHSCNVGAAQIGLKMGPHALYAADARFGLFDPLHIDIPAAQRGVLSFDKKENVYSKAKVARVAFGHSITTTPLHVAMAYAALANGGVLMQPRLVTQVTDADGKVVKQWDPKIVRHVIAPQTSAEVTDMLCDVVEKGTGKTAALEGYRIAGKTGTAKKYKPGKYIASFIGYLPASPSVKPRAVILVTVDEPQAGPHYGAQVAAPAFHAIAQQLMSYWKVPEDDPDSTQQKAAQNNLKHDHDAPHAATSAAAL